MGLARHAIDANRFGFESETKIIDQSCYSRILDAGIRLEFVSRDHGAGTDEFDLAGDIEFAALLGQLRRHAEQFIVRLLAPHLRFIEEFD